MSDVHVYIQHTDPQKLTDVEETNSAINTLKQKLLFLNP